MRKVDRTSVEKPAILDAPFSGTSETELDRLVKYFHEGVGSKKPTFKRYKEDAVKRALKTLFFGKCAYCEGFFEDKHPVDVEHYRPKGKVANTDHSGYWWLAGDWENLLPSCIDCNRARKQEILEFDDPNIAELLYGERLEEYRNKGRISMGKKDAFPLEEDSPRAIYNEDPDALKAAHDAEVRMLLDPTRDDPEDYITFDIPEYTPSGNDTTDRYSLVLPLDKNGNFSEKGHISSLVFGLNRLGLIKSRTRLLRELDFLWEISVKLKELDSSVDERLEDETIVISEIDRSLYSSLGLALKNIDSQIIGEIANKAQPEAPYSALVKAWINARLLEPAIS